MLRPLWAFVPSQRPDYNVIILCTIWNYSMKPHWCYTPWGDDLLQTRKVSLADRSHEISPLVLNPYQDHI